MPKSAVATDRGVTVGGMAKGAGMLAPELATMLSVVTTDAVADAATLDRVLRRAAAVSFDRVDSDGCMSTNDTVLLLASGASGVALDEASLTGLVTRVCADLARQLIADAEGASKDVAIEVVGAAGTADAIEVARAVARSNLLKCALHGEDPNWGRVLSALGTTRARFEPDAIDVGYQRRLGLPGRQHRGRPGQGRPQPVARSSSRSTSTPARPPATVRTNDLTAAYVHENSAYST